MTSVLTSSSTTSVTSGMTADSRIKSLQSNMECILQFLRDANPAPTSPTANNPMDNDDRLPSSSKGGDGT